MSPQPLKAYPIILAKAFPQWHPSKGQPTHFRAMAASQPPAKIHTIRNDYYEWQHRFKKIEAGTHCLSLREWEGQPYRSKQIEVKRLTVEDGIGLQMLQVFGGRASVGSSDINTVLFREIADNDGLSVNDLNAWLKRVPQGKALALIHFTTFRYY